MSSVPKKSIGAWINYGCSICNIEDNFTESFSEKISKIKTKSCEHFDFKFIYNPEKGNMKYMISFSCKKCKKDNIEDLYKFSKDGTSSLHYKCINCNNGDLNFQMILNEEALKEQNKNLQNNMGSKNINNNMNNNINNNSNNFNFIQMNNFNQSINNIRVIGGNMNQNNMMPFNNFNNNIMNNMNPNLINNNFNMINNNFNNMNMNNGFNNINFMMENMNLNNKNQFNVNNNINNTKNTKIQNQKENTKINEDKNSIKLHFKVTTGLDYFTSVPSLDIVFSEVARKLLEENPTLDENKIKGFACGGTPLKYHKTLRENNIEGTELILIFEITN